MDGFMSRQELTDKEIIILKDIARSFLTPNTAFIKGGMLDIAYQVCRKHEIELKDLQSKAKTRHFVVARIEFTKRCLKELNKSMNQIGRFLNKDHTTIIYYKNYE